MPLPGLPGQDPLTGPRFPLVGDALVIDHLSRDADPQVRAASARAAWARRPGGDPGVLARLSADPDPEVREVATSGRSA